jgi:predicted nucleic acid-binding protein
VRFPYLDASALAKRYVPEPGSSVIDHLFDRVPVDRMTILSVGLAEVAAVLIRKRNAGVISMTVCQAALADFWAEVGPMTAIRIIDVTGDLAERSSDLIDRHSINATDAILLRTALDLAATLRPAGDDVLVVASDQRLLRAARAEGLTTFDPETQSESDLDAILGP